MYCTVCPIWIYIFDTDQAQINSVFQSILDLDHTLVLQNILATAKDSMYCIILVKNERIETMEL